MALLLVIGAAYAAYKSSESSDLELDPEIDLQGKTSVELLPLEHTLSFMEAPLATISFFDGDYKAAAEYLRMRVADIVYRNPWLGGWLLKAPGDRNFKLYYDPSSDDIAPDICKAFEPGEVQLRCNHQDYAHYDRTVEEAHAKVRCNKDLVGKNESIFKIAIIPDLDSPGDHFALVTSMSHVGGDALTFYQIYNMLFMENPIRTLNPTRKLLVSESVAGIMGKQETFYIQKAVAHPLFRKASTSDDDDPLVTKHFYVRSSWLEEQLESSSEDQDGVEVMELSKQSVISSWFFNTANATIGLVSNNIRNHSVCGVSELDAGNYNHPIPLLPADYATPALVEQAMKSGRRRGSDNPLPTFTWDATFSISLDWSEFYEHQINLGNDGAFKEVLHMPLYDIEKLTAQARQLSFICTYTARASDGESKSRLGAMVVARKSLMDVIEGSSSMEEQIMSNLIIAC